MIPFLGRIPDYPAWNSEELYNNDVTALMLKVYKKLSDEAHRPIAAQMSQLRNTLPSVQGTALRMSEHQRFALASLHCQLAFGGAEGESAESVLPCARDLAWRLNDPLALAEYDFLHGWLSQERMAYAEAANCFELAVNRLKDLRDGGCAGDLNFELRARAELAVHQFLLTHYADAERHVDEGLALSLTVPEARSPRASLLWVQALLQRWRGNLEDALTSAFDSADLLERDVDNPMFGRIQGVAGEIALDLADRFCAEKPAHGRSVWLAIAFSRIEEAKRIAHVVRDRPGNVMAKLAGIRHSRMSHENINRVHVIGWVRKLAKDDATLHCQIDTALGHEYEAQGDRVNALKHYHDAMAIVGRGNQAGDNSSGLAENEGASTDQHGSSAKNASAGRAETLAQAFTVWPQRELLRAEEMAC